MAEETPVESASGGDTTTTVQGDDTPQAAPAAAQEPSEPIAFSFADDTAGNGNEDNDVAANVPSSRLREEADKRRAAETANAQLQQQNAMMQAMLQQRVNQNGQQPQPEADPLRQPFGNDSDGEAAYQAVKDLSAAEARTAVDQAKAELRSEYESTINQKFGGITASLQLSTKLNEMQQAGMIDDQASKVIGQRVGEFISRDPGWANHQEMVADRVWADMMRTGEIKARRVNPSSPNGNSIHQPGTGGMGAPSADDLRQMQDNKIADLRSRFPRSFRNRSNDEMRASLGDVTQDTTPTVEGPNPSTGEVAPHMSFVHTRG